MSAPRSIAGTACRGESSADQCSPSTTGEVGVVGPSSLSALTCGRRFNPADTLRGLADAASADTRLPCGVVSRFDQPFSRELVVYSHSRQPRKSFGFGAEKFDCSICYRRTSCLCPSCAAHKVDFYKKRGRQMELLQAKEELMRDIYAVFKERNKIEEELQRTKESTASLKLRIEETKHRVKTKSQQLKELTEGIARHHRNNAELIAWCAQHEKAFSKGPSSKAAELEDLHTKLFARQRELALQLFLDIFPIAQYERKRSEASDSDDSEKTRRIREQIAEASRSTSDGRSNWTMLVNPEPVSKLPSNIRFSISGCFINDCGEYGLREWLKVGLPSSHTAEAQHSAFAALIYCIQLVGILPVLFDTYLPYQLSLRDVALCEKWTEDLFDTDVMKLNLSVLLLCLSRGIDGSLLELRRPFANLVLFYANLDAADPKKQASSTLLTDKLLEEVERDFKKVTWSEREQVPTEDDWCLVQDEEVDLPETPPSNWARSDSRRLPSAPSTPRLSSFSPYSSGRQRLGAATGMGRRLSDMFSSTVGGLFSGSS